MSEPGFPHIPDSEDPATRKQLNRELLELLNELRIALPGVTVLFAFLLTLPFSSSFDRLSQVDEVVYYSAFMCTAVSSVLLMAPGAQHRVRWRKGEKDILLRISNRLAIAGFLLLAAAISQVVFLVSDLLFNLFFALLNTGIVLGMVVVFWFAIPLMRSFDRDDE